MAELYLNAVKSKGFTRVTLAYGQKNITDTIEIVSKNNVFGFSPISVEQNSIHKGLDIANSIGSGIPAAADGVVFKIENEGEKTGYGHYIVLQHKDQSNQDVYTIYAQMLARSMLAVGQSVKKGNIVGYVGETGNATGPHLHFEIRKGNYTSKQTVDPATYDLSNLATAKNPEEQTTASQTNTSTTASPTAGSTSEQDHRPVNQCTTITACTEDQFIIQVMGKDHPAGQRVYIADEQDQEINQQPEKEELTQSESTTLSVLHKWDWEKHKNKERHAFLEIATTEGAPIKLNLMNNADITPKKLDQQVHQIVPIVPCTIVKGIKSNQDSGAPVIARAGFFYIFETNKDGNNKLWRELQIITKDNSSTVYKDIPIQTEQYYKEGKYIGGIRKATGVELKEIWVPNVWSLITPSTAKAGMQRNTYTTFFYSEVQLSAPRLNKILSTGKIKDHPTTYLFPNNLNANIQSFKKLPLKGKELLEKYKDLDVSYKVWQNSATVTADVTIKNFLSSCYPATAIAPHRQRDIDLELQLIHPANYLYDLENDYFNENKQLADSFLANARKGNKTQNKHLIEFATLLPKIKSKLTTKQVDKKQSNLGENSEINTLIEGAITNINNNIGEINNDPQDITEEITANTNILQDAQDRQIYCITVEDHHFYTRQLTNSVLISQELLGASIALATEQKYCDSAILVQRLICPIYLDNRPNPLRDHLKKLDQRGIKQLAIHSCAYERGLASDQYNKSQTNLYNTLTKNNSPYLQVWVDHMSQDPKELYIPAYNNLVFTLGVLNTNIARVDPFNTDGTILIGDENFGGYDTTLGQKINKYITSMTEKLDNAMHQLLFSDLDKEGLKKPYDESQKPVVNDGTGKARIHLLADFRKTSGSIIADKYTQISYDAKTAADLLKSNSISDTVTGTGKAFAGYIGALNSTLSGLIEDAFKQLTQEQKELASSQQKQATAGRNLSSASQAQQNADQQVTQSAQTVDQATLDQRTATAELNQARQNQQQTNRQLDEASKTANQTAQGVNTQNTQVSANQAELNTRQGETVAAGQATNRAQGIANDSGRVLAENQTAYNTAGTANRTASTAANNQINQAVSSGQGLASIELYAGTRVPVWRAVTFQHAREVMQGTPVSEAFYSTLLRRRQGTSATERLTIVHVDYTAPNGITARRLFGEILDEAIDPQTGQTNTTIVGSSNQGTARGAGLSTAVKTDYPIIVTYENSSLDQTMKRLSLTNQQLQQATDDVNVVNEIHQDDLQNLNQAQARQQQAQQAEQQAQQQLNESQQALNKAREADAKAQSNLTKLRNQQGADVHAVANAEQMAAATQSNLAKAQANHSVTLGKQQQATAELNTATAQYKQTELEVQQRQQSTNAANTKHTTLKTSRLVNVVDSQSVKLGILTFQAYNLYQSYQAFTNANNNENRYRSLTSAGLAFTDVAIALEDLAVKLYPESSKINFFRKTAWTLDPAKLPAIFREGSVLARKLIVTRLMAGQVALGIIGVFASTYDLYYSISLNENSVVISAGALAVLGSIITAFSPLLVGSVGAFLLINPVGWVGIIISVIGVIVATWFTSNDIELWLVNGPFGDPDVVGSKLDYLKDPAEAYYQLIGLFTQVKISYTKVYFNKTIEKDAHLVTVTSQLQGLLTSKVDLTTKAQYNHLARDNVPAHFSDKKGYPKQLANGTAYIIDNATPDLQILGPHSLEIRAQFKTKYKGQDFYFPAPKLKDKLSYKDASKYPVNFSKTGQPFWADQKTNK